MPMPEEISFDGAITLNWSIENFSLVTSTKGKSILSANYEFRKLGLSFWQLELFPKGSVTDDYVACYVWLEMEDSTMEWDTYHFTLSVLVGDQDVFTTEHTMDFHGNDGWKCDEFIRIDSLKRSHLPKDVLTIQCKIRSEVNEDKRSDLKDFDILSRDLLSLLESGKHCDMVLETANETRSKVHKAVLAVRWPTLMSSLGVEGGFQSPPYALIVPSTTADTLETLIKYAYSGTIHGHNVTRDVFKAAVMFDFKTVRKNMACYPKTYFGVTELNIEHKTVIWHLDDVGQWERTPPSFIRVLPIIELYAYEIILIFSVKKDLFGDDAIDVAFRFSLFKEEFPISMNCKMSLLMEKGEVVTFHTASHLFCTNDVWHFPHFIKKRDIIDKKPSQITMELTICDGPKSSRIDKTETEFFSEFVPIRDLRKLSTDMSKLCFSSSLYATDSFLVSRGGRKFPVHKVIIWARWPQLRRAFDDSMFDDTDHSVDVEIAEQVLQRIILYVYSGSSGEITIQIAEEILQVAGLIPEPLKVKCEDILKNSLN